MAKNTTTQDITVNLTVPIKEDAFAFWQKAAEERGKTVDQMLASAIRYWTDHQARGGIFLEAEDAQYLTRINGSPFPSGKAIVRMIEQNLGREEGQYTQKVQIDPALIIPLEERAGQMGWTATELLTDVINLCLVNGWAYDLEPEFTIRLTQEQYRDLGQALGKAQFFGADVVEKLRKSAKKEVAA